MRGNTPSKKTPWDLDEVATVECPSCHDVFLHKRSLECHLKVEHGPQVFYWCGQCEHRNNRRDHLRAHYRDCHPSAQEEVDHIRAESYESRERPGCSKSEELSRRRSKEKKSSSSGRSGDRSNPCGSDRKRSRDNADAGDKSSKRRTRKEGAPATVSRAPDERQKELPVDDSGKKDAPAWQNPERNPGASVGNEGTVGMEERPVLEEVPEATVEAETTLMLGTSPRRGALVRKGPQRRCQEHLMNDRRSCQWTTVEKRMRLHGRIQRETLGRP